MDENRLLSFRKLIMHEIAELSTNQTKAKIEMLAPGKVVKVATKKALVKESQETSLFDRIVGHIRDSETGMTTAELKDKTGLTARQIWGVTSQATKVGKIKTTKRGVYVPV